MACVFVACSGSVDNPGGELRLGNGTSGQTGEPTDDADAEDDGNGADPGDDVPAGPGVPDDAPDVPPPGGHPIFVAQGHMGRTTVSCDDGRTWVHDQSSSASVRCFEGIDCDHGPGSAGGIIYNDGTFYATFGWGQPGGAFKSVNGVDWTPLITGTTFSNMAIGGGWLVGGDHYPPRSNDLGQTWSDGVDSTLSVWTTRNVAYVRAAGGLFLLLSANDDQSDLVISRDFGATWQQTRSFPARCGVWNKGIFYEQGKIIIVDGQGSSCISQDGGETFVAHDIGGRIESAVIYDGARFHGWIYGVHYSSQDAVTWSSQPTVPESFEARGVARSDSGTFVASNSGWVSWYEQQKFWRSSDGTTWEELPRSAYNGSHPINHIAFGRVANSPCD